MRLSAESSYDEVPYESYPYPQTHPDRLCTIGTLLGLHPTAVDQCRVLELGCAAGGNLIPLAVTLPRSSFLGIDLSRNQVNEGHKIIADLGIGNIELRHASVLDVDSSLGKFDYIICHGVYSWVPDAVQEKILSICKENLSPAGIAFVSYNTYPGWHMRGMIRDMMDYHARQFADPRMKAQQARNLLNFLARSVAGQNNPYSLLLKSELESIQRCSDSYLFHEHLEEINEPIYFYQFAERVERKGLRYLGEAEIQVMIPSNFPPEIANVLQMIAPDNIHLEQYMDFLRNRMFRQTLLCHQDQKPVYGLKGERIFDFSIASPARPANRPASFRSNEPLKFATPAGVTLESREPLTKAAFTLLSEVWPGALTFRELLKEAQKLLETRDKEGAGETAARGLATQLLGIYGSASNILIELSVSAPRFTKAVKEKPTASPLVRWQAARSSYVTNLRHETVVLNEMERAVVSWLDGTVGLEGVAAKLADLPAQGRVSGNEMGERGNNASVGQTALQDLLSSLASKALFLP